MAVDGSRVEVPDSVENRWEYGASVNQYGAAVARANCSAMDDGYNRFIVDIGIHHFRSSEIAEARAHLPAMQHIIGEEPVLIVFDRNYVSLECMKYLEQTGVTYLIRLIIQHNGPGCARRMNRSTWRIPPHGLSR